MTKETLKPSEDICAACGEPIEFRPGESFVASTDGKAWHYGCAPRRADALESSQAEIDRLTEALRPFASFAEQNVDAEGWNDMGLSTKEERVVDWFGPTDFINALDALQAHQQEDKV